MNPFSNLLEGMTFAWPNAILATAVFITLLYRPERITNRFVFKMGCVFFVLSLLAPSLVAAFLPAFSVQGLPVQRANAGSMMRSLFGLVQPLAFAIAFLCLVWSLLNTSGSTNE